MLDILRSVRRDWPRASWAGAAERRHADAVSLVYRLHELGAGEDASQVQECDFDRLV